MTLSIRCLHSALTGLLLFSVTAAETLSKPGLEEGLANRENWPPTLRVEGNRIVEAGTGKEVWLQGVNVVSLEFLTAGEHVLRAVQVAVDDWGSNLIRLPVREDYWFGQERWQNDGGRAYRERVDAVVTLAANRGAYVLLDLHRFRAPRPEHIAFWKKAAARYQNHPAVLFDLFNEPHGISWEVWRSGGFVSEKKVHADEDAFLSAEDRAQNAAGFSSPGMQGLADAVRSTGARNLLVAGGLDWAYDLTGVAAGHALEDKGGNGIVYSTHIYPWKRGWEEKILGAATQYPVLVGEVGCDLRKVDFVPLDSQEDPATWAPDVIGFIQKHRLHWTAWSFHPRTTPVLISDWNFTPTPFWGEQVKQALAGKKFEMKQQR